MNIPEPLKEMVEELKKREREQKDNPAKAARDIYASKGEHFLTVTVNRLIFFYNRNLLKAEHPYETITDTEWGIQFLEEALNILGVKQAANLVTKDMAQAISIWLKYRVEQANGNN